VKLPIAGRRWAAAKAMISGRWTVKSGGEFINKASGRLRATGTEGFFAATARLTGRWIRTFGSPTVNERGLSAEQASFEPLVPYRAARSRKGCDVSWVFEGGTGMEECQAAWAGSILEMRKLDLAAAWPAPFLRAQVRGAAEPRIEVLALVP
jgi:hypothetical protein